MKRFITWSFSVAVLIGLAAGIYFLTLSSLALAEEKGPAGVWRRPRPLRPNRHGTACFGSGTEVGPDRGEYRGRGGCYRRFRRCSDQRGPGKASQKRAAGS